MESRFTGYAGRLCAGMGDFAILMAAAFLYALTDSSAGDLRKSVPTRVPSGLPLAEINSCLLPRIWLTEPERTPC